MFLYSIFITVILKCSHFLFFVQVPFFVSTQELRVTLSRFKMQPASL
jgi:hypothetical protein